MQRILTISLALLSLPMAQAMKIGSNFWNLKWHKPDDCFRDVRNVTGDNPWNPQFLNEIAIYNGFRFMDWDVTNNSKREKWTERTPKSSADQTVVAYEWMIDLCNRLNADMWVCLPHPTANRNSGDQPNDYALRLCLLVKTGVDTKAVDLRPLLDRLSGMTAEQLVRAGGVKTCEPLKPGLKLYLEYSNETWNGSFKQSHYCVEEGTALKLDPKAKPGNDGKLWGCGFRFHAWAALRAFRAADLVWGAGSPRVVRVLALQSGSTHQAGQHQAVLRDPRLNPWGTKADAIAAAPYFGRKVPGNAADAVPQLRQAIQEVAGKSAGLKELADREKLRLIAYEGGQHVMQQANVINRNPAMFDLYREYLAAMSKYYDTFYHYAHVGRSGDKGAWGCIEHTGQPVAEAPKYRALAEWSKARPGLQ